MHIRLLHSVFDAIEADVHSWKTYVSLFRNLQLYIFLFSLSREPPRPLTEFINLQENQILCANVVHMISQMAEVLCNACGGLLPLLASATSASVN